MPLFARSGYRSKNLFTDLVLGVTSGLDMSLWCYVYASLIFAGALSTFLPVGVLCILLGWLVVGTWIALTSDDPLHLAEPDDQGMVIFGSIAGLLATYMGAEATGPGGLATMLCVIFLTTLAFALCCYLVARYRISRLLELLPYPVICGFMASIGWLLLQAGIEVMADTGLSTRVLQDVVDNERGLQLGLAALLGLALMALTRWLDRSWLLPVASALIVSVYYLGVTLAGMSHAEQQAQGWLFNISTDAGGVSRQLAGLRLADIDWSFIVLALPQMLTILLLALLYASMTLSALNAASPYELSITREYKNLGRANLMCAAVCCPPGYTEVVSTVMFRQFGASSRWLLLASSAVGICIVVFGGAIIGYLPKLLIGATIFLFTFQMLYEWLYEDVRDFTALDFAVVLCIFGTSILFGFMAGIALGILLTVLLFVLRYSMISAVHARHTLAEHHSSVERSAEDTERLRERGSQVVIYSLRGFLFFGTANGILDTIQDKERLGKGGCQALLLDLSRVTGMDISAYMVFTHILQVCEAKGVLLACCGAPAQVRDSLLSMHAVSEQDGRPLMFEDVDFAIEFLENRLLQPDAGEAPEASIKDRLLALLGDPGKAGRLLEVLRRKEFSADQVLFRQGDQDDGLYIVECGSFSAFILHPEHGLIRVRKFKHGSLIGELSGYLKDHRRSATIVAETESVAWHLERTELQNADHELAAMVHEMVAATLAERVSFMNERLNASA